MGVMIQFVIGVTTDFKLYFARELQNSFIFWNTWSALHRSLVYVVLRPFTSPLMKCILFQVLLLWNVTIHSLQIYSTLSHLQGKKNRLKFWGCFIGESLPLFIFCSFLFCLWIYLFIYDIIYTHICLNVSLFT